MTMNTTRVDVLRLQLENNVAKLRNALKHWRTWEAEYEGLKEELESLPKPHSEEDVVKLGQDYEGDLSQKEVRELLGIDKGPKPRDVPQILGLLDRRNDYVQKNIETLKKQLEESELKLEKVSEIDDVSRNEEGLPITDIYEELDEDGNVITGRTSRPGEAQGSALQALEKLGIDAKDLVKNGHDAAKPKAVSKDDATEGTDTEMADVSKVDARPTISPISEPEQGSTMVNGEAIQDGPFKRTVRFIDDPKDDKPLPKSTQPQPKTEDPKSTTKDLPATISKLTNGSFNPKERVVELDSDDEVIASTAAPGPINESPEDAALRARMLEYNLREVGNIVAQLDIEEGEGSGTDYDEDLEYDFDGEDDDGEDVDLSISDASDAEDDDEYGISRGGIMTDDYIQEMLALEKRLNARMFQNVGPKPGLNGTADKQEQSEALLESESQPISLDNGPDEKQTARATSTTKPKKPKGKAVRFAQELDIAPTSPTPAPTHSSNPAKPPSTSPKATTAQQQQHTPISETVIERKPTSIPPSTSSAKSDTTQKPKKQSRFKSSISVSTPTHSSTSTSNFSPQQQQQKAENTSRTPLASTIIERSAPTPSQVGPNAKATPPKRLSEFDPEVQNRQIEEEIFKNRNKMIQQEGGYLRFRDGGEEDDGLKFQLGDEEGDGGVEGRPVKKMSLFKRARMSGWDPAGPGV